MFKMMKWAVIGTAGLGAIGFVTLGTDFPSYLATAAGSMKSSVQEQIPVEFEMQRAEKLVNGIEPQIRDAERNVARAEVELERMHESVERLDAVVKHERSKLERGREFEGETTATLASDDRLQVALRRADLEQTFDSYRNHEMTLKTKQAKIKRQTRAVAVAKQRLQAMRAKKESLADDLRALEAQKNWLDTLAVDSNRFEIDDSALTQAKALVERIRNKLDVDQRILENDVVPGSHGVAGELNRDIRGEINAYFDDSRASVSEMPGLVTR